MNISFYLFVFGVDQRNGGGAERGVGREEVIPRFPCFTSGVQELFLSLIASEVVEFGACGVTVDD